MADELHDKSPLTTAKAGVMLDFVDSDNRLIRRRQPRVHRCCRNGRGWMTPSGVRF
jgi:hypothetical protein